MPASQHQSPKSDIEISQAAKKRPILDIAKERLGIAPENLEPYGHYKAKVSIDYIKTLKDKNNGKLILVSAISPTPAGETGMLRGEPGFSAMPRSGGSRRARSAARTTTCGMTGVRRPSGGSGTVRCSRGAEV